MSKGASLAAQRRQSATWLAAQPRSPADMRSAVLGGQLRSKRALSVVSQQVLMTLGGVLVSASKRSACPKPTAGSAASIARRRSVREARLMYTAASTRPGACSGSGGGGGGRGRPGATAVGEVAGARSCEEAGCEEAGCEEEVAGARSAAARRAASARAMPSSASMLGRSDIERSSFTVSSSDTRRECK